MDYDCIIVGGGMVGAALALGLARQGYKIAVIEKNEPEAFDGSQNPDIRLSAFNMHSVKLLKDLHAWQHVEKMRYRAYNCLKCWDGENTLFTGAHRPTIFHADEVKQDVLGYFVENRLIQLALYAQINSLFDERVDFIFGQSIQNIDCDSATLHLDNATTIKAEILFGTDGANSIVRKAAGIGTTGWQYSQHANAILIETVNTLPSETWQAFYHSGPRALLPMYDNYACLVWYDSVKRTDWIKQANNNHLHKAIITHFPDLIGDFSIKERASFGLTRMHATRYSKGKAIVLGDAAHTINPLAGQGVNLGFQDVSALLDCVATHGLKESESITRAYEKTRKVPNLLMMSTMDVLYKGFSSPYLPIQILRGAGLKIANNAGPLKQKALKYAMGL